MDLQPKDSPRERAQILSRRVSEQLSDPALAPALLREYPPRDWAKESDAQRVVHLKGWA